MDVNIGISARKSGATLRTQQQTNCSAEIIHFELSAFHKSTYLTMCAQT